MTPRDRRLLCCARASARVDVVIEQMGDMLCDLEALGGMMANEVYRISPLLWRIREGLFRIQEEYAVAEDEADAP